jgi:hypothetical protein
MHDYSFALQYHLTMMGPDEPKDDDSDELVFPKFGKMAMKEKDEDLDSRVSQLWTHCFEELVTLYESYQEKFQDLEESGVEPVIGPINKKLTSHHGKKAANMTMADSSSAGLAQIFRTGWAVRTLHTVFDYVVGTAKMNRLATKNQNGWHFKGPNDEIIGGYPQEIKDIIVECGKVRSFMLTLFGGGHGHDTLVLELAFAGCLRFYDNFVEDVVKEPTELYVNPINHPYVAAVHRAMEVCDVSEQTFDAWKKSVQEGFVTRNRPALPINFSPSMEECLLDPRTFLYSYNALATSTASIHRKCSCCPYFVQNLRIVDLM